MRSDTPFHIVDFDDFGDTDNGYRWLVRLKLAEPDFRATLMCVAAKTSDVTLRMLRKRDWLDPAVHGWDHHYLECGKWTKEQTLRVLLECELRGFSRIWRCPCWEISDGVYAALLERDWVCCDHPKNRYRRPDHIRIYETDRFPNAVHGHITADRRNGIEENIEFLLSLHGGFALIRELDLPRWPRVPNPRG